jgi:putative ABC transport system ATP-binding protein
MQIELKNLSKTFKEGDTSHTVLKEINETIREGEIIILLGKSGSGKSTILNLLSGIDLPTTGDVLIKDQNIVKMTERERTLFRRKNIGFIFQFFNLIPTLTVRENLVLPLELNGIGSDSTHDSVNKLLAEVGLEHRGDSYPDLLSGGEQQRVAIARALVHNPSLLLADEPTGNLDFETGLQVIELLDKMVRSKKKTMIMATHSKDVIGLADRILTIKEGKLIPVENGSKK